MVKRDYTVLRPHLGDKMYEKGDTRTAEEASVGHLVKAGVLAEVKEEPPVELSGGDDEPAQAVAEPDKAETASAAPETKAAASVPETKASLFSEAETAAKNAKSAKAESGAAK
ncbi:hypothetical protein SAMN04488056_101447 [Cohaesibacter marisflavi]|uniref:Uncharacterized protein n=1 Tax=Cohaesibacter marisflavi TaxID=655353 RepID=A0A1I5ADJ4_9HYPH|nr:hypothetical protein [Cohaesibacter marisflavi]SFN60526.1 hypothetical protein SAMN04488056_101447 [Cohaesibacter marisflavi]